MLVLSAIRLRRNQFKGSGLWLKAHLLLISWSGGCVMPLLALRPATQSPHPPSLVLSSELSQSLVERRREAKPHSRSVLEAVCARCRRLRCLTNSCKTRAVDSAERPQAQTKSVQREWAVAGSSPAAHLLVRGLCGAAAGSPACNTITAPAIVSAELRAQSIIG